MLLRRPCCFALLVFITTSAAGQQTIYWKKDHIYVGGKEVAIITPNSGDQTAPTAPTVLSSSELTTTSVLVSWTGSTDSGGSTLVGYKIYRGLFPVGTVGPAVLSFRDEGLRPSSSYTYRIVAFDKAQNHSTASNVVTVVTLSGDYPDQPTNLLATATSTTQVNLNWTASSDNGGVRYYHIERNYNNTGWAEIATLTGTSYQDTTVASATTYLYWVRAEDWDGNVSGYGNIDFATTVSFTDDPLAAGITIVKAQHFNELRQAVNAIRASAALNAASWTDFSLAGVTVKAVHVEELRSNLNAALSALGFALPTYTDPTLAAGVTNIKKAHVEELRQNVK